VVIKFHSIFPEQTTTPRPLPAPTGTHTSECCPSAAGATPGHLVRLTWFITDRDAYLRDRKAIGAAYRDIIGRHFPPMSVIVVAGLLEPGAMVEIEATAVIPLDPSLNSTGA